MPLAGRYLRHLSLLLLGTALFLAPMTDLRVFMFVSFADVAFICAAIIAILARLAGGTSSLERQVLYVFFLYTAGVSCISFSYLFHVLQGIDEAPGKFFLILASSSFIPLSLMLFLPLTRDQYQRLLFVWMSGGLYSALYAILRVEGWIAGEDRYWWMVRRAQGLAAHPNGLGINSMVCMVAALYFLTITKKNLYRGLLVAAVVILLVTIDYSGSRTAAGAAIIAFLLYGGFLVWRHRGRMLKAIYIALPLTVMLLLMIPAIDVESMRETSPIRRILFGSYVSDTPRASVNANALREWAESPIFGIGFQGVHEAHNLFLQLLHISGIFGLMGYLIVLLTPYFSFNLGGNASTLVKDRSTESVVIVSRVSILSILATGWVQPSITDLNMAVVFGFALMAWSTTWSTAVVPDLTEA